MTTVWAVLDIEPTTEAKRIRRAYATRLRMLDVDKDPDAFQRLRAAYEWALEQAARAPRPAVPELAPAAPPQPVDPLRRDAIPEPAPIHVPPLEANPQRAPVKLKAAPLPATELPPPASRPLFGPGRVAADPARFPFDRLTGGIAEALSARNYDRAIALYDDGLVSGVIPLGGRESLAERIAEAAMADNQIGADRFRDMAQHLDLATRPGVRMAVSASRQRISARLEAIAWLDILRATAAGQARTVNLASALWTGQFRLWRRQKAERRAARAFFGSWQPVCTSLPQAQALKRYIAEYKHYWARIPGEIPTGGIEHAQALFDGYLSWGRRFSLVNLAILGLIVAAISARVVPGVTIALVALFARIMFSGRRGVG